MKSKNSVSKRILSATMATVMAIPMTTTAFGQIITEQLPDGVNGHEYYVALETTEPSPAWSASGLPSGMSIHPTAGVLQGTPTEEGTFTVEIKDTQGGKSTQYILEILNAVSKPDITTSALPKGKLEKPYRAIMDATGGSIQWSCDSLPAGLNIDPITGVIEGTPSESGKFNFEVTAKNKQGEDKVSFTLEIADKVEIVTSNLPNGEVNTSYEVQLETADKGEYSWNAVGLPNGLAIDKSTGKISGIPTESGTFGFVVTAEANGNKVQKQFSLIINDTRIPHITTRELKAGEVGNAYHMNLEANGGAVNSWTVAGLPNGLSFNRSTGEITGTPMVEGEFDIDITAANNKGSDKVTLKLVITNLYRPTITVKDLPDGRVGDAYRFQMTVTGPAVTDWSAAGLPEGLNINPDTGVISGTPAKDGTYKVMIVARNANASATEEYEMVVDPIPGTFTVSATIDNNGTIIGKNPQTVKGGENSEALTFKAENGYRLASVKVNGNEVAEARNSTSYTFGAVFGIDKNYTIEVKTEKIPSREAGLGIDNTTANNDENISKTNAGGTVKVENQSSYDKIGFHTNQNTVSFTPADGWEHAATFDVIVTDRDANTTRITMKVPYSSGALYIAGSSEESQAAWDTFFPGAKATVRGDTVTIRFADDVNDMPYQVQVNVHFEPTLNVKTTSGNGYVSASDLSIYAEADDKYKISKIRLVDPDTGKGITITDLPKRENSRGEYYDRDTGDFAGLLTTQIAGDPARVWIEGNIDITKDRSYVVEADVTLDELPIALKGEISFVRRNSDSANDTDYDEDVYYEDGTGNLTIKMNTENVSRNKAFEFTLYFPSHARDEEFEIDGDVNGWVEHGDTIVLYSGEQATIYGLPEGARYSIEMDDPGSKYDISYDVSNGEDGDGLDTGNFSIRDGKVTTIKFFSSVSSSSGNTTHPNTDDGIKDNPHTGR